MNNNGLEKKVTFVTCFVSQIIQLSSKNRKYCINLLKPKTYIRYRQL